jgi:hypothetical protein
MALGPLVQGLMRGIGSLRGRSPSSRMDNVLKSMRTGQQAGEKFNKLTQNQLDDIAAKYGRETQALTDSVTRGTTSITSQTGYAKKAQELVDKGDEITRLIKILESQMSLTKTMGEARQLMEVLNRMRKFDSLIKGTIASLGAGTAGMYFGASEQRKNPDFYDPEDNPFKGMFGSPKKQMGSGVALDAVGEALEDMDNKVNGRK